MPAEFDFARYANPIFVETGTYLGRGVGRALQAKFGKVISIEIDDGLYEQACEKFANEIEQGRVVLVHGDSVSSMEKVVATLDDRATFWLDAHTQDYNIENGTQGEQNCPLYAELDAIGRSSRNDHTLLIDDLRLIRKRWAWSGHDVTEDGLKDRIKAINPAYEFSYENGYEPDDVLVAEVRDA